MRARISLIIALLIVYLLAVALLIGCVVKGGIGSGEQLPDELADSEQAQQAATQDGTDANGEASEDPLMPQGSHHGTEVLMMGRSVMGGWFDHWNYDWTGPVMREGYLLYYREVASPPDIGTDAASVVAQVPDGTIVFFKLCFVDFWAGNESDIQTNVDENIGYVNQVVDACSARGLTLVLGNALPQTNGQTTLPLVKTHRAYNAALEQIAAENDNVVIFDQYSLLADQNGALYKGLALAGDDSHLNDVAYDVLDEAYFPLLNSLQ